MKIKKYIKKFVLLRILFLIIRYLITCINTIIGCFLLNLLIDKIFPLPITAFHIYWFIILFLLGVFFVNLIYRILEVINQPYRLLQNLLKDTTLLRQDDILSSYLLEETLFESEKINFSKELAEEFINKVEKILSTVNLWKLSGFDSIKRVVPLNFVLVFIVYILYFLPPYVIRQSIHKIIFTKSEAVLGIFISPKNTKVQYKSPCEIKIGVAKEYEIYIPELFIATSQEKKNFLKVEFNKVDYLLDRKIYRYKIPSVEQTLYYKIKFRGMWSKQYVIEPILYPEVSKLKIKVIPPEYTNIKPYEIESFFQTKYIYGTKLEFFGQTNEEINEAWINVYNKKIKLKINEDKKSFEGSFVVSKDTELWFELVDKDGNINTETVKYKIFVIEDQPPKIEILSPAADIVVMPNSVVPIVYSVKDDISVSKIEFVYKIEWKNELKTVIIEKYDKVVKEIINEYMFDLAKVNVKFGDVISYYLIVYDNDTILGPKYEFTQVYKIEIFSYEQQHQELLKDIEKFVNKSLETLGEEIKLYDELSSLTTEQYKELSELILKHKQIDKMYESVENTLSSILNKMETDQYTSVDTYAEFKSLSRNINNIREYLKPELVKQLEQKDLSFARKLHQQIIDTLERATMLSKDIIKRQNMENIVSMMDENVITAKRLLDTLRDTSYKMSQEDKNKIMNLLNEIEEKLKKVSQILSSLDQQLPQDFINRREIKNIDVMTPADILNDIYNAISSGDITKAVSLAEKLLSSLENLLDTLKSASSDLLNTTMSGIIEQLNSLNKKLSTIIESEEQVYKGTKEIDDYRISEIMKQQEKVVQYLVDKANFIISKIEYVLRLQNLNNIAENQIYKINALSVVEKLKMVISEINMRRLIQTPQLLKDAMFIWQNNLNLVEKYKEQKEFSEIYTTTVEIDSLLKQLNELINSEPVIEYPEKVINRSKELKSQQDSVAAETEGLIKEMRKLGRISFVISSEDISTAMSAQNEMINASSSLNKMLIPNALQQENSAINLLSKLRNNIVSQQQQLQQLMQQLGKPMGSGIQVKTQPGGKLGVLTGRVLLPSVNDYYPPKELREDIIKSLSEKYPQEIEKIIEKYYKELLK